MPASPHTPASGLPDALILVASDLHKALRVVPRTLDSWIAKGDFPRPDFAVGRHRRWYRVTVERWLEERHRKARGGQDHAETRA